MLKYGKQLVSTLRGEKTMNSRRTLSAAVVAMSVIFSFAGTASAAEEGRVFFSCNIDGFIHATVYLDGAVVDIKTSRSCGPGVNFPMGDGFEIIFSEKKRVPPSGEAFLKRLEEGITMVKRVTVEGAPPKLKGQPVTIYLNKTDVAPVLERFLTSVVPNWKKETSPKDKK